MCRSNYECAETWCKHAWMTWACVIACAFERVCVHAFPPNLCWSCAGCARCSRWRRVALHVSFVQCVCVLGAAFVQHFSPVGVVWYECVMRHCGMRVAISVGFDVGMRWCVHAPTHVLSRVEMCTHVVSVYPCIHVSMYVSVCVGVCESACALHSCTVHTSPQALVTDAPKHSRWLKLCHKTEFHLAW